MQPDPAAPGAERLELLTNGDDGLQRVLRLIDEAKRDLRLLFYIFAADDCGERVLERLLSARRRGVEVTLIVDDFGTIGTPDSFFAQLSDSGGRFCEFQPRMWQNYLLRNHQKIVIADGERALVGSFNVHRAHMQTDDPEGWRDAGVVVEGAAARRLAAYYDRLHDWITSKGSIRELARILAAADETQGAVRWVIGGPSEGRNRYLHQLEKEFRAADDVDMIMGYFAPAGPVLEEVCKLAKRGRLRLVCASKTDVRLSRAAARHTYRQLLKAGAEIYEYQPQRLHTKLIATDSAVYIGSGNFDVRSLHVNLEIMLRVERGDFRAEVCDLFERELKKSRRIDLKRLKEKATLPTRIFWGIAYFLITSVDRTLSRWLAR